MPRSQFIDPKKVLQPGYIHFEDIPVNQYSRTLDEEKTVYPRDDMLRVWRDMRIIREFETMLCDIKTNSEYNGIKYTNPGPTHLAIGEEAVAVGTAFSLTRDDLIFGSHRNHGDVIAKGLSAIQLTDDDELYDIMKEYLGGAVLSALGEDSYQSVKDLAVDFLLYGTLSEIFAKSTGFNKGLGGSMHVFFVPFGIYPNNAIVGGAAPMALGAALYKRLNKKPGIVVANIGDGALGRGPVLESMNMSAMDQIKKLWREGGESRGLPILFNISDNFYGMGGQTLGETMGFGMAARVGAGINPEQMHSERINGYDPFAVIDAVKRKKELLTRGEGPALLDIVTYRTAGHSASDLSSYRTEEELETWKKLDPVKSFRDRMIIGDVASGEEFERLDEDIVKRITKLCRLAASEDISPRMKLYGGIDEIGNLMFSDSHVGSMDESRKAELLTEPGENPRVISIKSKSRSAVKDDGTEIPAGEFVDYRDALFEAIFDRFGKDPTLVAYGEENRDWGGANGVYSGLTEALPYERLFNAPISEAAIVGSAVGYAMCGGRALVELMYADFLGCAADELFNQAAKWQAMSAGTLRMPMVVRVTVGSEYGAQHSQDWTALPAHIPGLKVVCPATPYDAKGLMNSALSGTDPVVFFENKRIYDVGETFHEGGVPGEYYEIPLGEPDIKREGSDITILSVGAVLHRAVKAAEILMKDHGVSAEIIDARSVVPFDYEKVIESVKKTGRILIVGDGCERGSVMKDMASDISELAFDYLDAPVTVLGAKNQITPCHELEDRFFPQADDMIAIINERLLPLDGIEPSERFSDETKLRRAKRGL